MLVAVGDCIRVNLPATVALLVMLDHLLDGLVRFGGKNPLIREGRPQAMLGIQVCFGQAGKIRIRSKSAFRRTPFPLSGSTGLKVV